MQLDSVEAGVPDLLGCEDEAVDNLGLDLLDAQRNRLPVLRASPLKLQLNVGGLKFAKIICLNAQKLTEKGVGFTLNAVCRPA